MHTTSQTVSNRDAARRRIRGFTLIELMIVITIVAICATIADANTLLDGCTVPCKVVKKTQPTLFNSMVHDASVLDQYNSGSLTPGCTR